MNDRFKFRAWDKQNKRHIYDIERTYDSNNESGAWSFAEVLEDDNFIVEQCIGLKDKNGRLIYEGDICLLYKTKYEIRWKVGGFGTRDYPPCADTDGYIFSDTVPFTNRLYLREDLKEIEVVGTIHDNPDDGWPVTPQGKPLQKGIKTWER